MALYLAGHHNNLEDVFLESSKAVFEYLKVDFEANLKLVTKAEIRALNKRYRGLDNATDVLSFKLDEEVGGDIVICPEIAVENAKKWQMAEDDIYRLLVIHGILHLAGFDHEKDKDRVKMEEAESVIMAQLGIIIE